MTKLLIVCMLLVRINSGLAGEIPAGVVNYFATKYGHEHPDTLQVVKVDFKGNGSQQFLMTFAKNDSPSDTTALTGSTLKTEDIILRVGSIFVGRIDKVSLGPPTISGIGNLELRVSVTQILKGEINGQVKLFAFIEFNAKEHRPVVGSSYIFFVDKDHDFLVVTKLIPATNDTIGAVKTVLPSAK